MNILLLVAVVAVVFATLAYVLDWSPVDDWRNLLKRWSTWLHGMGWMNMAAYLGIWNQLPPAVQKIVPSGLLLSIGIVLWLAGALAVYVKQEKLHG